MLAVIISSVSLLLSLVVFYNSNIRVIHDLYIIVVYPGRPSVAGKNVIKDYSNKLIFRLVLVNNGNRSEAILRLSLGYSIGDICRIDGAGPAPFVMKPGDIEILDVSEDMETLMTNLSASKTDWSDAGISITAVVPGGSVDPQFRRLAKIRNATGEDSGSPHIQVVLDTDQSRLNIIRSDSLRSWIDYLDYV